MIDLDIKNLRKIRNGWFGLVSVCVFLSLFMLAGVYIIVMGAVKDSNFAFLNSAFIGLCLLFTLTIVGTLNTKRWGRVLGIFTCVLLLLWIPIGTVFGVVGLFSFRFAKPLFQSDITYKDIKLAYQDELAHV